MTGIVIRAAAAADLPFLREMLLEAAFVPEATRLAWRARADPPPALAKYVDGWGRPGDAGVLAETATGRAVGAAWYRLFRAEDRGEGVIARPGVPELSIAVERDCRRLGVGRALLSALMQRGRDEGYRELILSVAPDNGDAIRLYERLGFRDAYPHHPSGGTSTYMSAAL